MPMPMSIPVPMSVYRDHLLCRTFKRFSLPYFKKVKKNCPNNLEKCFDCVHPKIKCLSML